MMLALCFVGVFVFIVRYLFSNKYGILYVGSRVYEITYNITKKRTSCRSSFFLYYYAMHLGDYLRMEYMI